MCFCRMRKMFASCSFGLSQLLSVRKIRRLLVCWTFRCLLLLTVCVLLLMMNNTSPLSEKIIKDTWNHPARLDQRADSALLFQSPGLYSAVCPSLSNKKISDKTQLEFISSLFRIKEPHLQRANRNLVKNCTTLKSFYRWPVTAQEEQFPLAFSVKIHKNPYMLERILSVLWRPQNFYCIHVDRKSPSSVYQHASYLTECFDNVIVIETRINVVYATIRSLQADIECVKAALSSPVKWKYHINLCGQEFPLKTNLEMVQILTALNGTNDVENYPVSKYFASISYQNRTIIINDSISRKQGAKTPFHHSNVELRKGSAYNCLSRPFLTWSLSDKVNLDLLNWLDDTWAPDELFWATISYRKEAPGGPGLLIRHDVDTMLSKAMVWMWDRYKCKGVFMHAICIFSALDLPWLLKRHELIANKFDQERDSLVLDCLEWELERRALSGYKEAGQASADGHWPLVTSLNWTHYRLLPQFARA